MLQTPTQEAVERKTHTNKFAETNELFELTRSTGRDTEADLLDTQVRGVHVLGSNRTER